MSDNEFVGKSFFQKLGISSALFIAFLGAVKLLWECSILIDKHFFNLNESWIILIISCFLFILGLIVTYIVLNVKVGFLLLIKTYKLLRKDKNNLEKVEKYLSFNDDDLKKIEQCLSNTETDLSENKHSLPSSEEELKQYVENMKKAGIKNYWGNRKEAESTIKECLMSETVKEIFISAIGFKTVDFLVTPEIIEQLKNKIERENLSITIVSLKDIEQLKKVRNGFGEDFLERQFNEAQSFLGFLKTKFSQYLNTNVYFKCYAENMIPRHFLMKIDNNIFFGSYLNSKIGSDSYLFQIDDSVEKSYQQFFSEIKFMKKTSTLKEQW